MGTFNKGILGGFSGKVGTVVGAYWRGKNVMRSLPRPSTKPATPGQELQRTIFSVVAKFLNPIKFILAAHFGSPQGDKSRFNLATSYHMTEAVQEVGDLIEMDLPKVLISKGSLQGLQGQTFIALPDSVVRVRWDDNSGQGLAGPDDTLTLVIYSPTLELFEAYSPAALRQEEQVDITAPNYLIGQEIHGWATFITPDGELAATSTYLGTVTVT
ncbi:MAG: DUF6266 family protein [Flavobacteriaceae bacterium]